MRMRRDNAFGRVCLSVFPVRGLTSESLDLKTSFLLHGTSSEYLGKVRISRSSGQSQGHRIKSHRT